MEPNRANITDLELKHGRDVNLLLDLQRPQIANALNQLSKTIANAQLPVIDRMYFFENHILKNYLTTFDSQYDSIREAALAFLRQIIKTLNENKGFKLSPETQTAILARVLSRVSSVPFKEQSEEVRLAAVTTLTELIPHFDASYYRLMGETTQTVAALLQDKYPEVKKTTCLYIERLIPVYGEQIAAGAKRILIPLTNNCFHAHSKIRKITVEVITKVIVLPRVEESVKTTVEALSPLANEKLVEIREALYKCYSNCLNHLSLEALKENEVFLMCELMAGVEDESPQISEFCRNALECFADRRKELFDRFGS